MAMCNCCDGYRVQNPRGEVCSALGVRRLVYLLRV